ncbi:MAG: hypothetical protein IPF95_18440 [Flavobacteriales bacterium]|nr:hypothetical protein [Flavobacteriales bacterium]
MPIFPAGLRYLSVGWVDWNAVPALPSMLETFKIIGASTDVLLPVFPNSLWSFIADGAFTNGIPQLPSGLRQLDQTGLSTDIGQPAFPSAIETIALNDCSFTECHRSLKDFRNLSCTTVVLVYRLYQRP